MKFEDLLKVGRSITDEFTEQASDFLGDQMSTFLRIAERSCKSEIEKLFLVAWAARAQGRRLFDDPIIFGCDWYKFQMGWPRPIPIEIAEIPGESIELEVINLQFPVGKYRADFALRRASRRYSIEKNDFDGVIQTPIVVVECDGHDYHERTKEQAAHDRERDRFMQTSGIVVLRFTGSEIWRDPASCARQVDLCLTEHLRRAEGLQKENNREFERLLEASSKSEDAQF